jgi:hypothetical protein
LETSTELVYVACFHILYILVPYEDCLSLDVCKGSETGDDLQLFPMAVNQSDLGPNRAASPVLDASSVDPLARTSMQNDQVVTDGRDTLQRMELVGDTHTDIPVPGPTPYDETSHQDSTSSSRTTQPPLSSNHALSNSSTVPPMRMDRFEAYVEDSLGSYAPSFMQQQQHNQAPANSNQTASLWPSDNLLHNREPVGYLRPLEVNMSSRSTLDLEHQVLTLDSADMAYLKAKGAFDLPPRKLQEDLVEAYFSDVHPTAPVINRHEFLSAFYGGGSPSPLLLFAIFTSGSRACRHPALLDSRGTNQSSAQRFYKATKVRPNLSLPTGRCDALCRLISS